MRRPTQEEINECVNALNGLLLISTDDYEEDEDDWKVCQCPQRASSHFYEVNYYDDERKRNVSMPSTGFFSFLHTVHTMIVRNVECVNALNGLLLISTAQNELLNKLTRNVSMPSTGFFSFLR